MFRLAVFASVCFGSLANAANINADPSDYLAKLKQLQAGDVLLLAPGQYVGGLAVHGLLGTAEQPIVIRGSGPGKTRFLAKPQRNTISIVDSAHVTIRDLMLDGLGFAADAVRAEGYARWAHHISLENLVVVNHGANQGYVGISTKCPAWNWAIRGNLIIGAGTGMYLGNSDGRAPFVAGIIEQNQFIASVGYNLQIKHQATRPDLPGMPRGQSHTIIRRNLFVKARNSSRGHDARPSLLVGHWPLEGPGKDDRYEIHGNLFYQNPGEALFQGEGNLAFYNNLLVNAFGDAIHIQPHNDIPRKIDIFHNTVIASGAGITVRTGILPGEFVQRVDRNAVFAAQPLSGGLQGLNLNAGWRDVSRYLRRPFAPLAQLRLDPLDGKISLRAPSPAWMSDYAESDLDYEGRTAVDGYLGAYARPSSRLSIERWLGKSTVQGLIVDEK